MSSYFMINMDVDDEFNLLAASIQRCAAGMRRWGMEELTLGLYKLFRWHELEGAIDTISGPKVQDIEELEEMCYWFKWAMAAYQMDRSSIAESLRINEEQIKKHVRTSAVLRPSYYIAVDNVKCCLVMAIRGTQSPTDIMTDFNPHSEKFEKGYAHSGMLGAAKWIMEEEHENLQILLKAYPGHKFVLTGHSLGAGTASLLCIILQESFSKSGKIDVARQNVSSPMMVCWGFGCPPCVDKELAQQPTTIRNIVLQDDIIARLTPAALDDLHSEISKLNWVHILGANTKMKKIVELGQTIHGTLDGIETSLGYENGHVYQQIKSYGYSSLAAAKEMIRTRLTEYQQRTNSSTTQSAFDWLSYGASTIIHCADMFTNSNVNHSQAGDAAIIMANAATIPINNPSSDDVRLYIPGILYHVICKDNPKHVQHIPLTQRSSRSNTNNEEFTEEEVANKDAGIPSNSPSSRGNYHNQNERNSANAPPLRCVVIKEDDWLNSNVILGAFEARAARLALSISRHIQKFPDQDVGFEELSVDLVSVARAHCQLIVLSKFIDKLHGAIPDLNVKKQLQLLCNTYGLSLVCEHVEEFLVTGYMTKRQANLARHQLRSLLSDVRPNAIALVDSFDHTDHYLGSVLGRYDGDVYTHLYREALKDPFNNSAVTEGYKEYIEPIIKQRLHSSKL